MSYSTTNPARKILDVGFCSTSGGSVYLYESSHASTDITSASFFQGCAFGSPTTAAIGMQVRDLLCNVNTQTNAVTWHRVTSITTSTGWHSAIHATVGAGSS
ncbi:hypothetical protein [Pseudogulbenkiania sp. NH8B]|uniref:hypothetical protein n=1 Tax=Pseudogulbenkiania sp. (strain NH8B) TaxID=748280 RepID=UPI0009FE6513|nr:hypothetical protein [Pseudogulbenkiania sp. NH8B]